MNLFWKKHTEPVPVVTLPENDDRRPDPDPVTCQPSNVDINKEAARRQAQLSRLTSAEVSQVQEQLRLSLLKLDTIQRQIDDAQEYLRQHKTYVDFKAHHDEVCADLYAKTKTLASMRDAEQRLCRFEACEEAMPLYLSLQITDRWQQKAREVSSSYKELVRQAEMKADKSRTCLEAALNAFRDSMIMMRSKEETIATGHSTHGQRLAMQAEQKSLDDLYSVCSDTRTRYVALRSELMSNIGDVEKKLSDNSSVYAPLNSNREAMENMGAIIVQLDNLKKLADRIEELSRLISATSLKQRDLNNRLSAMFEHDQTIEQQLMTLHSEIDMHRSMNLGLDGSALQMRVVDLRGRKQALIAAAALWKQICELHEYIEKKRREARQMQHEIERAEEEIIQMEMEVNTLDADAAQRRYDYTLSKGQNVIKMRSDLREGIACAVCGATTHPFHSDTLLEQNKLIGEWKNEADQLDMELRHARQCLLEKQIKNATAHGTLTELTDDLERSVTQYAEMVKAWSEYEYLDVSLHGCQPAAMADSRTMTIRGIIENCTRDESWAKEQLDTYNYHQQAINRTQVEIDKLENERQELHSGLGETNTGCQVLAAKAEYLQDEVRSVQSNYQSLYEMLDKVIDVADWHRKWQSSHDNFKSLLRDKAYNWARIGAELKELQLERKYLQDRMEQCDTAISDLDVFIQQIDRRRQDLSELDRQAVNLSARLFGERTVMQVYQGARDEVDACMEAWINSSEQAMETLEKYARSDGQREMAEHQTTQLTEAVSSARGALDDWMYQFRIAGNPPCRIDELSDLFDSNNNWTRMRDTIRKVRQDYDLASIHEEEVRTSLLALETSDSNNTSISSRESLLRQRREQMLMIARYEQKLAAHEQALKQLEVL